MSDWVDPVECPRCRSKDTRFVEYREDSMIYECNLCSCIFEIMEE
jgi:DNA-directed RNA polymerase subunit RPC12/RpoP